MEIALSVETKLKPTRTAWQNADGAEKPDLRESESGFYPPHQQQFPCRSVMSCSTLLRLLFYQANSMPLSNDKICGNLWLKK